MTRLKYWVQASRAKFFIATIIPLALGGTIAAKAGAWDAGLWMVIFLASFLVHLNTNLANDFFELDTGVDGGNSIGGSRVIQEGKISSSEIRNFMLIAYFISLLCGLYLLWETRLWWLIGVMLLSFFSSLFYTAPPIRYGYHGMGELMVGLNMGPIMVAGTASTLIGRWYMPSLWISLPIGILVAFILYYQSLSDIDDDRRVNKRTIAVRLGRENILIVYWMFAIGTSLSIVTLFIFGYVHPVALLSAVTPYILKDLAGEIKTTRDIRSLHDKGKPIRQFYVINGMILIFSVMLKLG